MTLIAFGSLTLNSARVSFSPLPPAGAARLIVQELARSYGVDPEAGVMFRSATGQVLAALVSAGGEACVRGTELLHAGVDALRACWVLDRARGALEVHVTVQALRAGGAWSGVDGRRLAAADLVFSPSLHASAWVRTAYPALLEADPAGWHGLGVALNGARFRLAMPRHPRLVLGVEGELGGQAAAPLVRAGDLTPTVVRCSHPEDDLWEVLYAADLPGKDALKHVGTVGARTVALLTTRPGQGGSAWALHWQSVQGVDAQGEACGPMHVYHARAEPDDLAPASEVDRTWLALALAQQAWPCTHRNALDWPVACVPIFERAVQGIVA
jgi:hypothetical protein